MIFNKKYYYPITVELPWLSETSPRLLRYICYLTSGHTPAKWLDPRTLVNRTPFNNTLQPLSLKAQGRISRGELEPHTTRLRSSLLLCGKGDFTDTARRSALPEQGEDRAGDGPGGFQGGGWFGEGGSGFVRDRCFSNCNFLRCSGRDLPGNSRVLWYLLCEEYEWKIENSFMSDGFDGK